MSELTLSELLGEHKAMRSAIELIGSLSHPDSPLTLETKVEVATRAASAVLAFLHANELRTQGRDT
ncbi:hypothetical protein [Phenylobacterium deserti]|uniref:Uncharacterized protein n=1 Tax=Phenylobacterium deserti TaxID=1914756 RepID=A0A328ABK7_9CAUL|nr:hypothetical protein [Phenylobacterium deserti]RAK52102.1 hypothetical protein DJ018_13180 [Phenylobacterium deserti]